MTRLDLLHAVILTAEFVTVGGVAVLVLLAALDWLRDALRSWLGVR